MDGVYLKCSYPVRKLWALSFSIEHGNHITSDPLFPSKRHELPDQACDLFGNRAQLDFRKDHSTYTSVAFQTKEKAIQPALCFGQNTTLDVDADQVYACPFL